MAQDDLDPGENEGRIPQARRLAEQALAAERSGDEDTADRLFAEAERLDPAAVADVALEEDSATAAKPRRQLRAAPLRRAPGLIANRVQRRRACTPGIRAGARAPPGPADTRPVSPSLSTSTSSAMR